MAEKSEMRRLEELVTRFFVRTQLDDTHVLLLKRLYESGADIPALLVTDDGVLIDGRHRKAALEILGRTETLCRIVRPQSGAHAIAMALAANSGGALATTTNDLNHVIRLLLERRKSTGDIVNLITAYTDAFPAELIRNYVREVKKNEGELRLNRAVAAVRDDNLTVEMAAKKYDVEVASIRHKIKGPDPKEGTNISHVIGGVSLRIKSTSSSLGNILRQAEKQLEEGLVDEAHVRTIFDEIDRHIKRMQKTNSDRYARFLAKYGKAITKTEPPKTLTKKSVTGENRTPIPKVTGDKVVAVLEKMGLAVSGEIVKAGIAPQDFVLLAIEKLKLPDQHAIHVVFSNFNDAFRSYYPGSDPVAAIRSMTEQGLVGSRPAKGGAIIYPPFKNGQVSAPNRSECASNNISL